MRNRCLTAILSVSLWSRCVSLLLLNRFLLFGRNDCKNIQAHGTTLDIASLSCSIRSKSDAMPRKALKRKHSILLCYNANKSKKRGSRRKRQKKWPIVAIPDDRVSNHTNAKNKRQFEPFALPFILSHRLFAILMLLRRVIIKYPRNEQWTQ